MLTRILTSVIGIPVAIAIIGWGTPIIEIAGFFIAAIGVYEFFRVTKQKYKPIISIGYLGVLSYFLGFNYFTNNFMLFTVGLLMLLLCVMVFKYPTYTIGDVAISLLGPVYVAVLLSCIILTRRLENGAFLVWLIFISAWGSDSCAYFAGKCFGKHKLAPILSPKKTVEGAVGGAVGAALLAMVYALVYNAITPVLGTNHLIVIISIVFVAAILSQIGDLAASAIKRHVEAKDFGNLFPGHGGVLDRFDSILFVAPFIYFTLTLFSK